MIKKMLAMLVAISCAFGAWADATHISGTDFSTHPTGDFITGRDDSGAATESTYWYNGNTNDFSGTIVPGTNGTDHVLDFESNITNPVYRTIEGCYGRTVANFVPHAVGSGLFVDTYVAFTPYLVNNDHAAPTKVTNEDKIVIWVRETEVEEGANITNLIVTAGYIGYGNQVSVSNYVADLSSAEVSALCNGQHRLTIKAIQDITSRTDRFLMGFVVYIDGDIYGEPLEYTADAFSSESDVPLTTLAAKYYSTGAHRLFPSLTGVKTSLDSSTLSSVGYAGVGQIGSVYFDSYDTSYPAFAGDNLEFNVAFGADVVSFDYAGRTYSSPTNFSVTITTPSVTISNVVYATGWKHKSGTWYNGSTVVSNQYDSVADSDYGTFVFANGTELTLAGFQANYVVGTEEFSTLFGGTTTEAEGAIAYAKRTGDPLKLIKNTTIAEGDDPEHLNRYIYVGQDEALIIDLNGFTLQGTDSDHATIVNVSGTLEVLDSSIAKTGKVLNSGSDQCLELAGDSDTQLSDGTFEIIYVDDTDGAPALTINSGVYFDESSFGPGSDFYLQYCIAEGKRVIDWTEETEGWYAIVGGSAPTTYAVTFSTNSVPVAEYTTNITAGATLPDGAIPAFTGGAWDLDPTNAVINAATNFNYTIVPSYTLTYATEYGAVPDGVVYTASTPDFALAAAPVTEVVGIEFAGWVIGSVTNAAGATYVVADHLENTTATAAWAPVVPTGTAIYLVMGSGVDSISTSFNGTDWTAYTDPLQDVELGSTLYIKGTSSVTGYDVPQFSIVVDDTHATEQTALVVNKSAIVYFPQTDIDPSSPYAGRDGTPALPFVIRNYADLVALRNAVANGTVLHECFEQVADIDLDGEAAWSGIGAFEVTSAGAGAFEGTYDGGNHVISNVTFDQHEYHGLFASAVGAVIKNLTVDVDGFAATSSFGGAAIAGVAENCYLTNLVATGTIIGQSNTPCTHSAAGIAVRMEGTVAYACTNRCEIWSGKGKLGGIAAIGQPADSTTGRDYLTLCSNEGDLHNTKASLSDVEGVGGLFGYLGYHSNNVGKQHITFTDCRSIGMVDSAASNNTGSFVGNTSDLNVEAIVLSGTNVTLDGMRVIYTENAPGGVTYGKSIGNGLVELCAQAAFETNNTYSTLYSGLTPTFAFEAAGTISFNTNLFAATAFAITATGDLDVDSTEAGGIVTFTASVPTPTDPWAPSAETDEAAAAKAAELFPGTEVAANVTTYAMYTNLVDYIKGVTSQSEVPGDITDAQAPWLWKSYILGANPLFVTNAVVTITDVNAAATAGEWDFIVKVTEGELTTAHSVAAAKVAALVKVRESLTTGDWAAPAAGDVTASAIEGNLIKVTVDYGTDASGFMKVSE